MTNIIILTGSARPNSAGKNIAKIVADEINSRSGASAEIVLVDELDLPFFNAPFSPSADEFEITDSNVKAWSDKVKSADAVIWLMPEYNNSISAIQKNAIDWLYQEWANKPLGVIAYGRYAGVNVLEAAKSPIRIIKADFRAQVGLGFTKHINPDGSAIDKETVKEVINPVFEALFVEA